MEHNMDITNERRIDRVSTIKDVAGQAFVMFVNGLVFAAGTHVFGKMLPGKPPADVIPMRKVS